MELLCVRGKQRNYAIDMEQIVEICPHVTLAKIPCLASCYLGLQMYQGELVVVLRLEDDTEDVVETNVVILQSKERFGIQLEQEPFMTTWEDMQILKKPEQLNMGIWVIEEICQTEHEVFYLIDIEESIKQLLQQEVIR